MGRARVPTSSLHRGWQLTGSAAVVSALSFWLGGGWESSYALAGGMAIAWVPIEPGLDP